MLTGNRRLATVVLLAALAAGAFLVYSPGLNGPFLFDDYPNLVDNPLVAVDALDAERLRDAAFSIGNRPYPHRGLARVSFALNYYFSGRSFDAYAFKLTNVVIHVLNGLLVYWLSVLLLRRYAASAREPASRDRLSAVEAFTPLLVTALWLLHPIQLTSVLYVVQRMTSMAALFVFAGLVLFVVGRNRLESGRPLGFAFMFAGLAGGGILGFLCKQNAALLPFFAFLVELFFFRAGTLPQTARRRLYGFYLLTVALPAVAAVVGVVLGWQTILEGYVHLDFTPWERLLTQSRVLFFYLGLLAFPHIRAFGLYHDDIAMSTGLLSPSTTLLAVVLWIVLAGLALWGIRRRAIWSFALLWYLVGHSMESSLLNLELVYEHRNYVPSYGVLFAAAYYLLWGFDRLAGGRRLAYPVVAMVVAVLAFTTFTRAGIWADDTTFNTFTAKNHPESYRSLAGVGNLSVIRGLDAREIYADYGRVAEARDSTIIALVEMSKIAAGMRALIAAGGDSEVGMSELPSDAELLRRPLVLSASYLSAAEAAIDHEIRRRLREYPVLVESAYAFERLRECIVQRVDVCVPLVEKLEEWYDVALGNPRMVSSVRGMLSINRASFHEDRAELDLAVERMRDAIALDPHNLSYSFTLAMFHIRHEQWDEAGKVLDRLEADEPWSGFGSRHVSYLREQYEARLNASGASVQ